MLVTHSGRFHADEVFAISMLLMLEDYEITRTR
ncbi:MAG: MYG1 family protein, partial [Gammaproteobacteria bacterium]|nr:MYG1 family protein [Gammaproteobacteria bacterium]